jgi:hypothetical protein
MEQVEDAIGVYADRSTFRRRIGVIASRLYSACLWRRLHSH